MSLHSLPGEGGFLVAYSDGLESFHSSQTRWLAQQHSLRTPLECCTLLDGSILTGGTWLARRNEQLEPLGSALEAPEQEPIRKLVTVDDRSFVSQSDDETVRYWMVQDGELQLARQWQTPCLPCFAKGKSVVTIERGRIQEREATSGTLLHTWKGAPLAAAAFGDTRGNSAVVIDQEGRAGFWDLHSREQVFHLILESPVSYAVLNSSGSRGVLLDVDGRAHEFRVVEGGTTHPLPDPGSPLVDVVYGKNALLGLDENGGLWLHSEGDWQRMGGTWSGWCTVARAIDADRTVLGTASGELVVFHEGEPSPQLFAGHQDAVISLQLCQGHLVSAGADGQVLKRSVDTLDQFEVLHDFSGETIVGCVLAKDESLLWVALEEGRVCWLEPATGQLLGEFTFAEHRVEEIQPGHRPDQLLVVTDRGSLKRIQA